MKKSIIMFFGGLLYMSLFSFVHAQDDITDEGNYFKSNVAVTKFRILGINDKQYAKCVETENFLDPDKKLRFLVIGKTSFADDGQGYDLVAGDGILTSNQVFNYTNNRFVTPNTYQESPDYNSILADELFRHHEDGTAGKFKIIISCKFKWVPCSQMSYWQAMACNAMAPPYGSFVVTECEIKIEF